MGDFDEMSDVPDDAACPACGVKLTPENVMRRHEGTAGAVVPTDVPGVDEEVEDVPVYVLGCMNCFLEGKEW